MKRLFVAALMAASLVVLAAAPPVGMIDASSGTTTLDRTFSGFTVNHLTVAPETADVLVFIDPQHAQDETLTVKAGDVMNWYDIQVSGFTVERPTATAVQIYWWR